MDTKTSAYHLTHHHHHLHQQTKKQTSAATVIVRSRPVQLAQTLARVFRIGRKEKISKKAANKIAAAKSSSTAAFHHQSQQQIVVMPPPPTMQTATPPPPSTQATQTSQVVQVNGGGQSLTADKIVNMMPVTKRNPRDYIFGKVIGEGSYSTVYLAKDIHTNREHAIKVCEKQQIIREKKREQVRREKDALNILSNSGSSLFVKLYCTFQDAERLYFVMSYAKNGDLLPYINKVGSFDAACTRFYSGEILRALEHLHDLNIMHRDLKPENILLDHNMHIKVADFGCSKIIEQPDAVDKSILDENNPRQRTNSFVGTAQYVSPELLTEKTISPSSDLWALGCIIYQMIAGLPPFRSRSEYMLFKKILNLDYVYPDGFNADAKDLVQKLLVLDPNERLGTKDDQRYTSIRSHPFYNGLDFDTLHVTNPPPIYPYLPGNSESQELRSQYRVPDHLEPGLDDKQLTRLLGLDGQSSSTTTPAPAPRPRKRSGILHMNDEEKQHQLNQQRCNSKWHGLVEGNLIVKQGLVDKRKGLFARRRMLMLTMGPHLYYADPVSMTLKGEIPWSPQLRVEPKNFRIFFVHTPNRTYYLEDPEGFALEWCKAIEEMRVNTYGVSPTTCT